MVTREDVAAEALSWLGTPFHDCAGLKGVGTDCVHFLIGVYSAVGLIEAFDPAPYAPQWFQHRDEPRFLAGIAERAHRVDELGIGDVAMFNFGRHAAHGAISLGGDTIIHAYKPLGRVTKDSLAAHTHRVHSYWGLFP